MIKEFILFAVLVAIAPFPALASDIVAQAETTELRFWDGKLVPRVERDSEGNVISLRLDNLQLSKEHFEQLGRLDHLRLLVLFGTNVSDQDLSQLEHCQTIEHLNLSSTSVTDGAIDSILKLKRLKSLCLGDVSISPEAVEKIRALNNSRKRADRLRLGYSQRKEKQSGETVVD